jgi:hypothetical protein
MNIDTDYTKINNITDDKLFTSEYIKHINNNAHTSSPIKVTYNNLNKKHHIICISYRTNNYNKPS